MTELSIEEVRGMIVAAGLEGAVDAREFADMLNRAVGGVADDLEEQFMKAITGDASPEAIAAARANAARQTREITGNLAQAELNKIAERIAENVAKGLNPLDVARKLQEVQGLDANRAKSLDKYAAYLDQQDLSDAQIEKMMESRYQKLLRDRRRTIARTEQRMATSEANQILAKDKGQKFKAWITAGDDAVSDMDVENEAAGWILIDETFPSGDMSPPSHPNCRCTNAFRTNAPDAAAEQRAKDRAASTAGAAA